MYKLLLFDIDETLFDFKKTERVAFERTFYEAYPKLKEERYFKMYKRINKELWDKVEEGKITQEKVKYERFRLFLKEAEIERDYIKTANEFMNRLSEGNYLIEGAEETVEGLKGKIPMIIVTNGLKEVQRKRVKRSLIGKFFDEIVVSDEIGMSKPDKRIFEYAIRKYGSIDKKEILMIGDSLTSDIRGGLDFGIDTCWYNPNNKENKEGITETYRITKLREILEIVKK